MFTFPPQDGRQAVLLQYINNIYIRHHRSQITIDWWFSSNYTSDSPALRVVYGGRKVGLSDSLQKHNMNTNTFKRISHSIWADHRHIYTHTNGINHQHLFLLGFLKENFLGWCILSIAAQLVSCAVWIHDVLEVRQQHHLVFAEHNDHLMLNHLTFCSVWIQSDRGYTYILSSIMVVVVALLSVLQWCYFH